LVDGTSSPPVREMAMRMARARALKAASALFVSELSPQRQLTAHMWWLFSPRMRSTCRVTPASKANDWSRCETISVDTKVSPGQEPYNSRTVSDLFAGEGQVADEERSGRDVDDGSGEGLSVRSARRL